MPPPGLVPGVKPNFSVEGVLAGSVTFLMTSVPHATGVVTVDVGFATVMPVTASLAVLSSEHSSAVWLTRTGGGPTERP